jgi:hypothetical protein
MTSTKTGPMFSLGHAAQEVKPTHDRADPSGRSKVRMTMAARPVRTGVSTVIDCRSDSSVALAYE